MENELAWWCTSIILNPGILAKGHLGLQNKIMTSIQKTKVCVQGGGRGYIGSVITERMETGVVPIETEQGVSIKRTAVHHSF